MKISNEISACKSCLYRNLLYGDLTNEEYELVNASRTELIYRRGEVMRMEGDPISSFMYLREGLVAIGRRLRSDCAAVGHAKQPPPE